MYISCVLALKKNSFISSAITGLINSSEQGLSVIESHAVSLDKLASEINQYEVDVILVDRASSFVEEGSLIRLLMLFSKLLVIIVNEENNWLQIYRREDILMTSSADLLSIIQSAWNDF